MSDARGGGADARPVPALLLRDLRVRLGGREVVRGVDLEVAAGEVVGIVGPPGAGKTSLLRAAAGALGDRSGKVVVCGREVAGGSPRQARDAGLAIVYQSLALVPTLSAAENIVLGSEPQRQLFGLLPIVDYHVADAEARALLKSLGVTLSAAELALPAAKLSGGQRQAVAIARALRAQPRVLLLDEPSAALGSAGREGLCGMVRRLAGRGVAVAIASHDIDLLLALAGRLVVLRRGCKRAEGAPETLDLERLREEAGEGPGAEAGVADRRSRYRFDPMPWIVGTRH